jgi:hypothetical protein
MTKTTNRSSNRPGRAEMLVLLRQRAGGNAIKDLQQTAMRRWPSCIAQV